MTDLHDVEMLEIVLGAEGQVWVNTEHGCGFRAYRVKEIKIEDLRRSVQITASTNFDASATAQGK